jgi:nicotinate-nucleotide pyrophosphorylase (carboxylating)
VRSASSHLPPYITPETLSAFLTLALAEDLGDGDHSTLATIPEDATAQVKLLVKDSGILAGVYMARLIYERVDPRVILTELLSDGDEIKPGDVAFFAVGPARTLLTTERLILNCMQRMSAIASHTHRLCGLLEGTHAKLMDTRKTTPNFRMAEKWAVSIGGGTNHRIGLYDKIMVKDNHIDLAGGIGVAVDRVKKYLLDQDKQLEIEVETRSLAEVDDALAAGVDIILLDNMAPEMMREAVTRIAGRCRTEASGGIHEGNLRAVALTGVDYISMGALTHTVRSLDLSLKAV